MVTKKVELSGSQVHGYTKKMYGDREIRDFVNGFPNSEFSNMSLCNRESYTVERRFK